MSKNNECHGCEHSKELHGCESKHVGEARKMISEGNFEKADEQLLNLEKHLKE